MLKRYTQTWTKSPDRELCGATAVEQREEEDEQEDARERDRLLFVYRARTAFNHCEITPGSRAPIRDADARVAAAALRGYNYVGRLALRHCVHLAAYASSSSDRRRLPEGTEAAAV